jgi:aspartyl-tRNA(Asn)/glutamyl-tRNA(Gln) amidotransferase subunit B
MEFEIVIGMEVHAQLKTKTKMFCSCPNLFGERPNTQICPVCLGLPGVLPVINKKAVEYIIKTGLALNCEISKYSIFHRKNYYYPDLPKNYQISQYDLPICKNGYIEINSENKTKKIRIRRIHLEEDAGKLLHINREYTAVDLNRTGVPLMEIVTEPDISTPEEAYNYLIKLKSILQYLDVCDCNMEEGSLRCEPNISLKRKGSKELGVKIELKNLNSFKAVFKSLEYEIKRQKKILQEGGEIVQETRRWDEETNTTISMRSKEEAHDYRYFPEPDLPPIIISDEWLNEIRKTIPELPDKRCERLVKDYGIPLYDAEVITSQKELADYYEECLKHYSNAKIVSNWLMSELLRLLNLKNEKITECKITPENFAKMLILIEKGTISGKIGKTVFEEMFETGEDPEKIVKSKGLIQITDEKEIEKIVEEVIKENSSVFEEFKSGKEKALAYLVGQVMKKTKGKANPQIVNKLFREKIK